MLAKKREAEKAAVDKELSDLLKYKLDRSESPWEDQVQHAAIDVLNSDVQHYLDNGGTRKMTPEQLHIINGKMRRVEALKAKTDVWLLTKQKGVPSSKEYPPFYISVIPIGRYNPKIPLFS
ncbi:hypothetical protein [Catalinimonas alkaloidigena]|nr:hypothetical protein [Catalinimonas alkaloidigena]